MRFKVLLIGCCATLLAQNTIRLEAGAHPGKASIADVAWIAGQWQGEGLGGTVEETWSHPAAGSMTGMFRVIRDNKVWFYELVTIAEENGSLVLRLKHFHPDMKGWEEKDKTVDFKLIRIDDKGAWFDGLSYLRQGPDSMIAAVVIGGKGEAKLTLKRVAPMKPLR